MASAAGVEPAYHLIRSQALIQLSYAEIKLVRRIGFEPMISALRGQRPWPLDERR
jgi:hypothetical protein